MKVNCPHCGAHYNIDDRRIPASGLNVKCPKCSNAFPVRREAEAPPPPPPPPEPVEEPFAFGQQPGAIPLPAPENPFAMPPQEPADNPFAIPPAPPDDNPFAMPPEQELEDSPFAMPPPLEPANNPFAIPPAPSDNPFAMPPPAEEPPRAGAPVAFGEIDFEPSSAPLPPPRVPAAAPQAPDPFASPDPGAAPPRGGEELEDLYGDSPKPAATPAPVSHGETGPLSMDATYQVRRRSGKVFGPFPASAIAEMLQKGELQGNEDVSSDRGESWQPMSGVAAFRDAAGRANAPPPGGQPVPAVPFGARIAPVKIGDGGKVLRTRPRWLKVAIAAVLVLLIAGVGVAGTFTPYGLFFLRAFRSAAERSRVAAIVEKARAGLARGDFAGEREALRQADEALTAAPDDAGARLAYVLAAGAVQQRHAAGPDAAQRAAVAAKGLADAAPGSAAALAADLALAVAAGDLSALVQGEAALEQAQATAKGNPDPEILAVLARSALARRDGARAAAQFRRLEELQPGTSRVALGLGRALVVQGKGAEARPIFEKALAADAALTDARIEAAAVAAAAGDAAKAKALLAPLLEPASAGTIAPLDRARLLTVSAELLGGGAADAAQVEKLLADAVAADGSYAAARVALANHRLRRSDPAGAVLATDPVAANAARSAELADVRVRALVGAGRALDASTLADAALSAAPGNPRLLVARGMVQEQTGKPAEAAASYRDAIARAPTDWEPRVALARLAMAGGDLAVAQAEIAAAVERSAGAAAPLAALGELKQAQGDVPAAEAAFRKALAVDEEHAPALIGLARISLSRGDLAGARASVERALAIDPGRAGARRLHGELLWKSGDLKAAEAELRSAAEAAPRDAVGFARLGAVRLELGDVAGALKATEGATALDINLAEGQFWLGRALLQKGELPGALTRLKRAIDLDPANALHHLWYGVAQERSSSLAEAVEAYRAAAAADPKLAEAWERAGNLYSGVGRCEDAVPAYEKALAAAPGSLRVKIAIADCRGRQGKHEAAIRILKDVLKADAKATTVYYKMARALHESSGVKAAIPWYERAVREEPENPMPYYYLGFAYKDRGQRAKAVQLFKQYLVKRPDAEDKQDIELEIEDLGG